MRFLSSSKIKWGIIIGLILFGAFLRAYHFSDWLHFELDQSRDAIVLNRALSEGPGELTLLGPKAAGTLLRLGPAFYYLQYLGGLVFGNTPQGIAYPTMIFSILTIPLIYVFLRRIFDRRISLGMSAIATVSLFLVVYGRFAWNPNSIPFFVLLTFYGLLRAVDNDEKYKISWFFVSVASMTIATQLHFLVFLGLPLTVILFIILKRPELKLKAWLGAIFIIIFLYVPVILNEIKTHGANSAQFFKTVTEKSEKKTKYNLVEKSIRAYSELSRGSFLILSGQEQTEIPGVIIGPQDGTFMLLKCDESCKKTWGWGFISLIVFTAGAILSIVKFFQEKKKIRKDLLLLIGIWIVAIAGIFLPIAYDISPRFFLLLVPIAFVFLGIILEFIGKIFRIQNAVLAIFVASLVAVNLFGVLTRFDQLARAATENVEMCPDRVLKERTRVTLQQQIMITDYMKNFYKENKAVVYIASESQYQRAIGYHFRSDDIPYDNFSETRVYRKGNYFLIFVSNSSFDKKVGKYLDRFNVAEKRQFGTLTVARLIPREDKIVAEEQSIKQISDEETATAYPPGMPVRFTWSEIFGNELGILNDAADEEDSGSE